MQMVGKPIRVCIKNAGSKSATCMDHIFANFIHLFSNAMSIPLGCTDHNLVVLVRETEAEAEPRIVLRR